VMKPVSQTAVSRGGGIRIGMWEAAGCGSLFVGMKERAGGVGRHPLMARAEEQVKILP
jgi:hypothetical protein